MVIAANLLLLYGRQLAIVLLIFFLQANIYRELVLISIRHDEERQQPTFKFFYYYWFIVCAFYFYVRTLREHFEPLHEQHWILQWVGRNHVPVAFFAYMAGIVMFVIMLRRRRQFVYQFTQFSFCHMALLAVVLQSTYLASNVFNGIIWFAVPCGLVVCNDCFAYIFGFFFGRTQIVPKLSKKKTWEGFIGAFAATLIFAWYFTLFWERTSWGGINQVALCPSRGFSWETPPCDPLTVDGGIHGPRPFIEFAIGKAMNKHIMSPMGASFLLAFNCSEFQLHALVMATFASLVAPFGGFFASGVKRTLGLKDFGHVLRDHGGFTDRMDCQLVMGSFSYMYSHYFIPLGLPQPVAAQLLMQAVLALPSADQGRLVRRLVGAVGMDGAALQALCSGVHGATAFWLGDDASVESQATEAGAEAGVGAGLAGGEL